MNRFLYWLAIVGEILLAGIVLGLIMTIACVVTGYLMLGFAWLVG